MGTHILDQTNYGRLLAKARPHIMRNDDDLERFTKMLLKLDELEDPSEEQKELAELLTALIEQYEAEHYSLPRATPTELIQFLLEQRGQSAKDLWPVFGSKGNTSLKFWQAREPSASLPHLSLDVSSMFRRNYLSGGRLLNIDERQRAKPQAYAAASTLTAHVVLPLKVTP
jgi:HTH-type transcriptional regulator/antitoxin HigA